MTKVRLFQAAAPLLLLLGACTPQKVLAPPLTPYDYRDRHPLVLADASYALDLFPSPEGHKLDRANVLRIRDYVADYRRLGQGKIAILVPQNAAGSPRYSRADAEVTEAIGASGFGRDHVTVGVYPVSDTHLAAPVRLTYQGLKAKTANRCGDWPEDLASGGTIEGWQNKNFWNFGCATQAMLGAQVADPRDIAAPRGETAADIEMRMRGIDKVRKGESPKTEWNLQIYSTGGTGGGGGGGGGR